MLFSWLVALCALQLFAEQYTMTFDAGADGDECLFSCPLMPTNFAGKATNKMWYRDQASDDAWRSGFTPANNKTFMEAVVSDATRISFRWKVSSEENGDKLFFYIDGVSKGDISGEKDWEQKIFSFETGGLHALKWEYAKNSNKTNGSDCAWVDQIMATYSKAQDSDTLEYGSAIAAPAIERTGYTFAGWQPAIPQTVPASNATYTAQWAVNTYTVTFDANGGDGGKTETLAFGRKIESPAVTKTGYSFVGWLPEVDDTVPASNVTYTAQWDENQYTVTFDAGAKGKACLFSYPLATNDLVCGRSRDDVSYWFLESEADGVWCSGYLKPSTSNCLETVVSNATKISFRWKVSSEANDKLSFYIDGEQKGFTSGEKDWIQKVFSFGSGVHTSRWEYAKNGTVDAGDDCAWVDQITVTYSKAQDTFTLDYGDMIVAPNAMEWTGYTFAGWQPEIPQTVPASNVTCTATWTPKEYTITFDANGGEGGTSGKQAFETPLAVPNVTRGNWVLLGWQPELPQTVPAKDTTYKAQWTNIKDLRAKQRLEEAGKVDVSFEVTDAFDCSVDLAFTATRLVMTNKIEVVTNVVDDVEAIVTNTIPVYETKNWRAIPSALSGDVGSEVGKHSIVWDINEEEYRDILSTDTVFTVEYEKRPADYIEIDLSGGPSAASYGIKDFDEIPSGAWTDEYKTDKLVLRRIEADAYKMGESKRVSITEPFYIGVFEVTQRQWELVTGYNPSAFTNEQFYQTRPVERVAHVTIMNDFLPVIREKTGNTEFNLPKEAQWEYACRAGTSSLYNNGGDTEYDLKLLGRYNDGIVADFNGAETGSCATDKGTAAVGTYLPNNWGLYDMHGNVWEWCADEWGVQDGNKLMVVRGGDWNDPATNCTSFFRDGRAAAVGYALNTRGFRLMGRFNTVLSGTSTVLDDSPYVWSEKYPDLAETFGDDYRTAFTNSTGKTDRHGNKMPIWYDFVTGTNPVMSDDVFDVTLVFDEDGNPVVGWTPKLSPEEENKRIYTKYGTKRLGGTNWQTIDGIERKDSDFNFFKVTVEMK